MSAVAFEGEVDKLVRASTCLPWRDNKSGWDEEVEVDVQSVYMTLFWLALEQIG